MQNHKPTIVLGIDPGVNTGFAIYSTAEKKLLEVETIAIHDAMTRVLIMHRWYGPQLLVRLEDARLRKWFGNTGPEVWKGAGSICRDCSIWQAFLESNGIATMMTAPKHNRTKVTHDYFCRLTGWDKKTNEHGRDAAMLVYGY